MMDPFFTLLQTLKQWRSRHKGAQVGMIRSYARLAVFAYLNQLPQDEEVRLSVIRNMAEDAPAWAETHFDEVLHPILRRVCPIIAERHSRETTRQRWFPVFHETFCEDLGEWVEGALDGMNGMIN